MSEVALRVNNVSKNFLLPQEKNDTFKNLFTGLIKGKNSKAKTTQHALQDISFEVNKGEFFGIVGRNGSGKSTLLKILAGIYQPTKGAVEKQGRLVPFIELGVGFNPELTGRENVFLNGALLGFSESEVAAMYDDVVAFAELEEFMDQKLKNYSSGMQVRLAFSMATRAEADILLIDEVLAVGDADFQRKCFDYFLKLKAQKKTVVFVSHDMNAVRLYCDRAILINDASLVQSGSAQKVSDAYTKLFDKPNKVGTQKNKRKYESTGRDGSVANINAVSINKMVTFPNDVRFSIDIEARQNTEELIVGFALKNEAKEKLVGTNSVILQKKIEPLLKGQKTTVRISLPNIFSSGTYYLDVALQTKAYRFIDDWEDAACFEIVNRFTTPYKISPEFDLTEER